MATHSSVLAWRIPGMAESGGLSHRVGHDWSDLAAADGLVIETYFLTVLEARNLRSKCQQGWFLLRSLFLVWRWLLACCLFTRLSRCTGACASVICLHVQMSSYKGINQIRLWSTLRYFTLITSLKVLFPNTDMWVRAHPSVLTLTSSEWKSLNHVQLFATPRTVALTLYSLCLQIQWHVKYWGLGLQYMNDWEMGKTYSRAHNKFQIYHQPFRHNDKHN